MIVMKIPVIQIGKAKGILLPKSLLKKYNIKDTVEFILEEDRIIIIKAKPTPRMGWEKAFKEMHKNGNDKLLIPDIFADEILD